ncbi:hypothetical protein BH23CHL2_BH23CHL2_23710 [soil metagenome]
MDPDILHSNPRRWRPFSLLSPFPMSPVTPHHRGCFPSPAIDHQVELVVGGGFDRRIFLPDDFELDRVGRFHCRQDGLGDELVAGVGLARQEDLGRRQVPARYVRLDPAAFNVLA